MRQSWLGWYGIASRPVPCQSPPPTATVPTTSSPERWGWISKDRPPPSLPGSWRLTLLQSRRRCSKHFLANTSSGSPPLTTHHHLTWCFWRLFLQIINGWGFLSSSVGVRNLHLIRILGIAKLSSPGTSTHMEMCFYFSFFLGAVVPKAAALGTNHGHHCASGSRPVRGFYPTAPKKSNLACQAQGTRDQLELPLPSNVTFACVKFRMHVVRANHPSDLLGFQEKLEKYN